MADDDPVLSQAEYEALLGRFPWIRSRDPYASLDSGWERIVAEMLDALGDAMTTVVADNPRVRVEWWTTKEKVGELRVFFEIKGAPASVWPILRAPVDWAEEASARICQRCGAPGRLRDDGEWLVTLCDANASESATPGMAILPGRV